MKNSSQFKKHLMGQMVKFTNRDKVFYNTVKRGVREYFETYNLRETGDHRIHVKALIFSSLVVLLYITVVFNTPPSTLLVLLYWGLIGLLFSFIGFNTMHDASHGSYSSIGWVNNLMVLTCDMMGASSFLWKIKHVIIHHTYTNTDDDDDIQAYPVLRLHHNQKWLPHHRYQHIYAPVAYGFLFITWVLGKDFVKYFHRRIHNKENITIEPWDHFTFWLSKIFHITFMLVIPIIYLGFWQTLAGYGVMAGVCGLSLSLVFQLAHVVETSKFPSADENNEISTASWAVLQVQETMDFSTKNRVLGWFLGGLNFQVVHHLFPRVSHVHYPAIQPIIKNACIECGITYNELPVMDAVKSHFRQLKVLGTQQQEA